MVTPRELAAAALEEAAQIWAAHARRRGLQTVHWCRYLALPEGQDRDDRAAAFSAVRDGRTDSPDLVPDEIAPHIQAASPARDDPVWLHNRGVEAFGRFRSTGEG